ncbi:hypothetical protein OsJ_30546 [Oryza sativa Japonica Group]|uniref:O-methyltransferase C-terminal domain-containing protein n=1 Tax=Oryza sativa subsp. japonica TaxID=39947 RepID=A3C219_ORYSJ|nr:hypothetical protein OsJ_30546 [Oryza sativa Japonica Group]
MAALPPCLTSPSISGCTRRSSPTSGGSCACPLSLAYSPSKTTMVRPCTHSPEYLASSSTVMAREHMPCPICIHEWFTIEQAAAMTPFEVAHGCTRWEIIANDAKDGSVFNTAMVEDSRVAMDIILKESCGVFQGISSLVDVGGGHGAAAAAIATAFPNIKCTVLDLPHIVAEAPTTHSNIQFVGGDFFEFIPAADVVLLKYILHAWQDDDCVKILRRCKEAILARDAGGKVIIIEVVVGIGPKEIVPKEMQILFDVFMMYVDGIEREEHEWKKIFLEAGFSDYKITPVLGARSIIEVYP